MGFGAAIPAEARAKLEKLKLEAAAAAKHRQTPSQAGGRGRRRQARPEDPAIVINRRGAAARARGDEHDERPALSAAVPVAEQGPGQGDARAGRKASKCTSARLIPARRIGR